MPPTPRQHTLSIAYGTYGRLSDLKTELTEEKNRNVTFSELLDQLMEEHRRKRAEEESR